MDRDKKRKSDLKYYYKIKSNPEYKKKRVEQKNKERKPFMEFILNQKKDKCCAICGYKEHTEILEFHHKNKEEKSFEISKTKHKSEDLIKEIAKCILLCPNCHRWEHRIFK